MDESLVKRKPGEKKKTVREWHVALIDFVTMCFLCLPLCLLCSDKSFSVWPQSKNHTNEWNCEQIKKITMEPRVIPTWNCSLNFASKCFFLFARFFTSKNVLGQRHISVLQQTTVKSSWCNTYAIGFMFCIVAFLWHSKCGFNQYNFWCMPKIVCVWSLNTNHLWTWLKTFHGANWIASI